jgi:uncharacterized protein YeaO (DUF488 family)
MAGAIRTRRWNEPREAGDGTRILVTRFRPRGLPKSEETWDEWRRELAPSDTLVKAFKGRSGLPVTWDVYRATYLREMKAQGQAIEALARRLASGENLTLLCSSTCLRETRCHRSLLRELLEKRLAELSG